MSAQYPFDPATEYSQIPLRLDLLKTGQQVPHDPATESSECLYLMLTTAGSEGRAFNVESVDKRMIQDTDQDGLNEFIDAWGTPLRFYRWPTDYLHYLNRVDNRLQSQLAINAMDPDGLLTRPAWFGATALSPDTYSEIFEGGPPAQAAFNPRYGGYFRLHAIYPAPPATPIVHDPAPITPRASMIYPVIPIIVSAGPDGRNMAAGERWRAFGLAWPSDGSVPTTNNLSARCGRVGVMTDANGDELTGASAIQDNAELLLPFVGDNIVSILLRSGRENK